MSDELQVDDSKQEIENEPVLIPLDDAGQPVADKPKPVEKLPETPEAAM
jgi:hypothetical protein